MFPFKTTAISRAIGPIAPAMRTHLPAIHSAFSRVPAIIEPMRYKSTASAAKTTRSSAVSPLSRFLDTEDNFFTPSFGRPVELMKLSRLLDAERDWFNAQYMYFNRMNTFGALGHEKPDGQAHFVPGYQLSHDEKTVRIAVDLPGVRMDDINVDLTNDDSVLHISGGRKFEVDGKVEQFIFDKRFTLGEGVDIENMSANLVDGVLTVTAPKLELDEAQAENGNNRKIPITAFDPNLDG